MVNLLTVDPPTYYDIALGDVGLLLAALALARLATADARRVPTETKAVPTPLAQELARTR